MAGLNPMQERKLGYDDDYHSTAQSRAIYELTFYAISARPHMWVNVSSDRAVIRSPGHNAYELAICDLVLRTLDRMRRQPL